MPSLINVVDDVRNELSPNGQLTFEVIHEQGNLWIVYITHQQNPNRAKVEFIIENQPNPEDTGVVGSVLEYGCISRRAMTRIMDEIVERL
jgi:hypothetical protein